MRLTLAVGVGSSLIRPGVGHQRLQHLRNPSPSVISITDPSEAPHAQSCLFSGKLVWRVCHLQAASILLQEVLAFGTSQSRQGTIPWMSKPSQMKQARVLLLVSAPQIFLQTSVRSPSQKVPRALWRDPWMLNVLFFKDPWWGLRRPIYTVPVFPNQVLNQLKVKVMAQ